MSADDDDDDWIREALETRRRRLENNECGECGTKVTGVTQSGRCVYLKPCGHRHGQGDAERVKKAFGL